MFSLKNFIKKGLIDAVGKMADYQVILNAVGWFEKGVLEESDLEDIQTTIETYHIIEGNAETKEEDEDGEIFAGDSIVD